MGIVLNFDANERMMCGLYRAECMASGQLSASSTWISLSCDLANKTILLTCRAEERGGSTKSQCATLYSFKFEPVCYPLS